MENKSISIQCDEVTKNIMGELQDDMINSLSKASKTMTDEVIEKIKPIEKKVHELNNRFEDFTEDSEEFQERIYELNNNISSITKVIEVTIESSIVKVMSEQSKMILEHNKLFNENLHKLLDNNMKMQNSIEDMDKRILSNIEVSKEDIIEEVKKFDTDNLEKTMNSMEESISDKIENMSFESLEEKLAILGVKVFKNSDINKEVILKKIDSIDNKEVTAKVDELEMMMQSNFFSNKELVLEKVNSLSNKIDEKELLIKIIHGFEKEFSSKIAKIQEEVEWGNKSFFSRIFGKNKLKNKNAEE